MACGDFSRESYRKRLTQGTFVSAETANKCDSYENTCAIFL